MAAHSGGSRNTSEEMENGRESERSGWKDGNFRKVYSQSSQFGVGLEEKLREDLELVSVQAPAETKNTGRRVLQGFYTQTVLCQSDLCFRADSAINKQAVASTQRSAGPGLGGQAHGKVHLVPCRHVTCRLSGCVFSVCGSQVITL